MGLKVLREHKVNILDSLEARALDRNRKSTIWSGMPSQLDTVTLYCKSQVASLLNDKTGYVVNEIRYRDTAGVWATIRPVTNTRSGNTLLVEATITSSGVYDTWRCGNSLDTANYHNEIVSTITVGTDQELAVTMKFVFTGLDADGNYTCASLLGAIGDQYDATISGILYNLNGSSTVTTDIGKVASNNTFSCSINPAFPLTTAGTYDTFGAQATYISDYIFHTFTGATVVLESNQELLIQEVFVFS
jgi:hypothetical protein